MNETNNAQAHSQGGMLERQVPAGADSAEVGERRKTGRETVLDAVKTAVLSDRNRAYGNPEDNFKNIADVWNWWFETRIREFEQKARAMNIPYKFVITPLDVAHMMSLMKMARLKTNPTHLDSMIDNAGYAACAGDFVPRPETNNKLQPMKGLQHLINQNETEVPRHKVAGDTMAMSPVMKNAGAKWLYDPMYWNVDTQNNLVARSSESFNHLPKLMLPSQF